MESPTRTADKDLELSQALHEYAHRVNALCAHDGRATAAEADLIRLVQNVRAVADEIARNAVVAARGR